MQLFGVEVLYSSIQLNADSLLNWLNTQSSN